jgi:circadian clock protein KaiC
LKEKGVTTVITGERGQYSLTRHGLEEYVSDCVILLDFRVVDQIATRRLRIVKYRGSTHGTNEYPFLIDDNGISVIPITSLRLDYKTSKEVISTGLPSLDALFKKGGFYEGSSTLITGTAGTAKTILAGYFASGSCQRKERVLLFSFEESPDQMLRNMLSIGIDLNPFIEAGLLLIHASRPTLQGLEMHLLVLHRLLTEFNPRAVIIDPISSLVSVGSSIEVKAMLVRLMDTLKIRRINALFTSLMHHNNDVQNDSTIDAVSSLADNWLYVKNDLVTGKRRRSLLVVKSRGMEHFNDLIDFTISEDGIKIQTTDIRPLPVKNNS